MPARKTWLARVATLLAVVIAALLTLALLAEGGMRLAAWVSLSARESGPAPSGARTVLAIGDSWTFGDESGDPARFSYPAQLQGLVDKKYGAGRMKIINRGRVGFDSPEVRGRLPKILKTHRPWGIVVQVGGVNWIGADRIGQRAVPPWLVRLSKRKFWGHLAGFRVVRLVGMLTASPEKQGRARKEAELERLRTRLDKLVNSREARSDRRAWPAPPILGCLAQGEPPASNLAALLTRYGGTPPEKVRKRAHTWVQYKPEAVARLLAARPTCSGAHILTAEACLNDQDLSCAKAHLNSAAAVAAANFRYRLLHLDYTIIKEKTWPEETFQLFESLFILSPKSIPSYRFKLRQEAERAAQICHIETTVKWLLVRLSGTPWLERIREFINKQYRRKELWELRDGELREDLTAILAVAREAGVKVMLLNYAPRKRGSTQCNRSLGSIYDEVHSALDVPLVDIRGLLSDEGKDPHADTEDYGGQGHPNAHGYGKIARAVLAQMERQGWL